MPYVDPKKPKLPPDDEPIRWHALPLSVVLLLTAATALVVTLLLLSVTADGCGGDVTAAGTPRAGWCDHWVRHGRFVTIALVPPVLAVAAIWALRDYKWVRTKAATLVMLLPLAWVLHGMALDGGGLLGD